ncbi:MAG: hypothetical protein K5756_02290 [Clostridiales bacterium]|nr:hypothetical protein [Clostridiales bacterium]
MRLKKITAVIAVFAIMLCGLCGCRGGDPANTEETTSVNSNDPITVEDTRTIKLPYVKEDYLDPYLAESLNNSELSALLFDPLYTVDEKYDPHAVIASGSTNSGTTLSVTLIDYLKFTDGSPLTSEDVVYSFDLAKKTKSFSERLTNFENASSGGTHTVIFTLNDADPFAENCLDFPVIKKGTHKDVEKNKTKVTGSDADETEVEIIIPEADDVEVLLTTTPTGSGRYVLKKTDKGFSLMSNRDRLGGYYPQINEITLVKMTDASSVKGGLEVGEYDFFFDDLSSGDYSRLNANTGKVLLNNMVYLAFNKENRALSDNRIRLIISMAADRAQIVDMAYQGNAVKAALPFNPAWSRTEGSGVTTARRLDEVREALNKMGFTGINKYNAVNDGHTALEFRLLVNGDNRFKVKTAEYLAQQLAEVNIVINIRKLSFSEYKQAVKDGEFDILLAETRLTRNMNILPLLKGRLSGNVIPGELSLQSYEEMLSGTGEMSKFITDFGVEMPFVPLCFRTGIAACSRTLRMTLKAWESDVFCDIQSWTY